MKKSFLLLPLLGLAAYITLSSNEFGYVSANRTGAGASTVGCGDPGCHGTASSPSTLAVMGITVDSAGTTVTHYKPGITYKVSLFGGALTSANLHKFGFQLAAAKVSTNTTTGQFIAATLPPQASISTIGGFSIVRHNTPKADSVTIAGSAYRVIVDWTAPAVGTGDVKFYGVINAVDGDHGASASDKWNSTSATLTEWPDHTAVGNVANNITISTFPNPVTSALSLQLGNAANGVYGVKVFDMSGKLVASQDITVTGNSTSTINMNNCAAGMYQVVVEKDGARTVASVVKN